MVLIFKLVLITTQKSTRNKNHWFFWEFWFLFCGEIWVFSLRTMVVIKNECMILLKNVLWCQLQFISLNLGLYMCQVEFVIGDKCVVGHFWLINFWFIHRTDAICLPLTHAREARITTRPCGGVQVVTWAGRVHIKIDQLHISRHYTLIISFLCLFNSPPGLIYCGGSYSYFTPLFFTQRLCQWRPNSGTN